MITPKEEYLSKLGQIQLANQNGTYFQIPEIEQVYKIDLNTRRCEAPSHLSVTDDHQAEILFFEVDRNDDDKGREAEIIFFNKEKNLRETIKIRQEAKPEDTSVTPSGNIGNMTWG